MKKVITREPSKEEMQVLESISVDELISSDVEAELVKQIQRAEGDVEAAKEKLMLASQRFVRSVAQKYVSQSLSFEELIAEGNKGLEAAIPKFDENRGFKFITYATWWIRQSIQQYIMEKKKEI